MSSKRTYTTPSGRQLTDSDIDRLAEEVATHDYHVDKIRRRGRPSIGSGPAQLVPVRLDPDLLESLRARAIREHATNSDVIRAALREYLAS